MDHFFLFHVTLIHMTSEPVIQVHGLYFATPICNKLAWLGVQMGRSTFSFDLISREWYAARINLKTCLSKRLSI